MKAGWEHFAHGADVGIRGYGRTKAEAFEQAAVAMTAVVAEPGSVVPRRRVTVACDAPDDELLFVEWLNRLIYQMAVRGMLFSRFQVRLEAGRLDGAAWGEPVDLARHDPAVEIKGATYTALRVACDEGTWVAQTVLDV